MIRDKLQQGWICFRHHHSFTNAQNVQKEGPTITKKETHQPTIIMIPSCKSGVILICQSCTDQQTDGHFFKSDSGPFHQNEEICQG